MTLDILRTILDFVGVGGLVIIFTLGAVRRKAWGEAKKTEGEAKQTEADAFKSVQDVYQKTINDLNTYVDDIRKDRVHLREERDELRRINEEMRHRQEQLEEKMRQLEDDVARHGRMVKNLRPLLCARLECKERIDISIKEAAAHLQNCEVKTAK